MYRIVDWDDNFENNRTRDLKRLAWVPIPNSHDGDGYTELLDHKSGAAHYGVWCAIVQVASKCDPRGTLMRDGARPHDAGSLSRMTRIPAPLIQEALERLTHSVGWIEIVPDPQPAPALATISQNGAVIPHSLATAPHEGALNGREQNGTEGNGKRTARSAYSASFEVWYSAYPRHVGKQDASAAYGRAIDRIVSARGQDKPIAAAWLLTVTTAFAASPAGNAGTFTPHPATWLNRGQYDDDPNEWNRAATDGGASHPRVVEGIA
jgi:hypothetical protein